MDLHSRLQHLGFALSAEKAQRRIDLGEIRSLLEDARDAFSIKGGQEAAEMRVNQALREIEERLAK